jgi:glycerol-3-phosphate acyltransferase PlsY
VSTPTLWLLLLVLGAFVAGSVPFGWIFARLRGIDLTTVGSGNIGATNAARALGKRWGIVVLVLDAAKGFVPVWLARQHGVELPALGLAGAAPAAIGFAAILGHVYSPWMSFRGGKGVATSLGVFLALAPLAAAAAVAESIVERMMIDNLGQLIYSKLMGRGHGLPGGSGEGA